MAHLRRWGVVYTLAALWLASVGLYLWAELFAQLHIARDHNQPLGWPQYWSEVWRGTFQALQAVFAGLTVLAILVVGFSPLRLRDDASRARVERKVDELASKVSELHRRWGR